MYVYIINLCFNFLVHMFGHSHGMMERSLIPFENHIELGTGLQDVQIQITCKYVCALIIPHF